MGGEWSNKKWRELLDLIKRAISLSSSIFNPSTPSFLGFCQLQNKNSFKQHNINPRVERGTGFRYYLFFGDKIHQPHRRWKILVRHCSYTAKSEFECRGEVCILVAIEMLWSNCVFPLSFPISIPNSKAYIGSRDKVISN